MIIIVIAIFGMHDTFYRAKYIVDLYCFVYIDLYYLLLLTILIIINPACFFFVGNPHKKSHPGMVSSTRSVLSRNNTIPKWATPDTRFFNIPQRYPVLPAHPQWSWQNEAYDADIPASIPHQQFLPRR